MDAAVVKALSISAKSASIRTEENEVEAMDEEGEMQRLAGGCSLTTVPRTSSEDGMALMVAQRGPSFSRPLRPKPSPGPQGPSRPLCGPRGGPRPPHSTLGRVMAGSLRTWPPRREPGRERGSGAVYLPL
ncbi:hypothetical protein ACOMHN_012978 [Nucella lapillus]